MTWAASVLPSEKKLYFVVNCPYLPTLLLISWEDAVRWLLIDHTVPTTT